jgi:hypothetical protein
MARSPESPSAPSPSTTEERRAPASVPYVVADSTRDVAQEDFLFHLYRGSELLQENRILEAKEELEFALTLQPQDPKGQDLLAAVYFRIGLYPRAIQIYEHLSHSFPRDPAIKINLALSYLKTGQPEPARTALKEVVRSNPSHTRAWGYLGLAHQKLGDYDQAQIAFERGGHPLMAKRMSERRVRASQRPPSIAPDAPEAAVEGVREIAETAFSELDAGEVQFALAEPNTTQMHADGQWHALEIGAAAGRPSERARGPFIKTLPPPSVRGLSAPPSMHDAVTSPPPPSHNLTANFAAEPGSASTRLMPPPPEAIALKQRQEEPQEPAKSVPPPVMARVARSSLLVFEPDKPIVLHPTGVVLVHVGHEQELAFAGRLEAMRVATGTITTKVLNRRVRDQETNEVLGGVGSPIVRITGAAELVLGARPAHKLVPIELVSDLAFVREDLLLGFEMRLAYENGKVSFDEDRALGESVSPRHGGDGVSIVQLRGTGALILELFASFTTVETVPGRLLLVRREWIVGWIGRLVPRALPPAESPGGQRGLVSFSGEGTVLIATG